ncbi:MAG: hypothetical protein PsegKO_27010 [Pseudohongiellaceae bacterium]|jgi:Zn-finger nucleic acid-binding protein
METTETDKVSCPKCEGDLEPRTVQDEITIERCNKCYGLLIPAGATKKLLAIWGPEDNIDTGSGALGRKYDKIDEISCPRCKIQMDKIEDPAQPHIWVENCASCGSTFFDAGELTDLKERTLGDIFKRFLKGSRK